MFHLHLNAIAVSTKAHEALESLGFELRNFQPAKLGVTHFVPNTHLSCHFTSSVDFKARFAEARLILQSDAEFVGFLEGEFISAEWNSEERVVSDMSSKTKRKYFVLFRNPLKWRESELHISIEGTASDSRITEYFAKKGFYSVHSRRKGVDSTVFTLQGDQVVIRELFCRLQSDLNTLSQGRVLRMKLERSAGYYLSPGFTWLPMQAYGILDLRDEERQ